MFLKSYTLSLLIAFTTHSMNQEIPMLKNLCALAIAKSIDQQLPIINSYEHLQKAYDILNQHPLFQKLITINLSEIHALIAKAFQKIYSIDLLLWHKTLKGHTSDINVIVYSPCGKQLASGSGDHTIKIWNLKSLSNESNACIQTLVGHNRAINSIAYNPNGTQLASGSEDKTIKIWDPASGNCIQTLIGHNNPILSVSYSPNGKQLVSCSEDKTIKIWDLEINTDTYYTDKSGTDNSSNCIQTLQHNNNNVIPHNNLIHFISYSPDGSLLASGSLDNIIKIWNLQTGQCIKILKKHNDWIYIVADSKQSTEDSNHKATDIWNFGVDQSIKTLNYDNNNGSSYKVYNPNGIQKASGSTDNTIKICAHYDQNPETVNDVLFNLLSSLYIKTNSVQKLINLYGSREYEQLSNNHKYAFITYIKKYVSEHPGTPLKELLQLIQP